MISWHAKSRYVMTIVCDKLACEKPVCDDKPVCDKLACEKSVCDNVTSLCVMAGGGRRRWTRWEGGRVFLLIDYCEKSRDQTTDL